MGTARVARLGLHGNRAASGVASMLASRQLKAGAQAVDDSNVRMDRAAFARRIRRLSRVQHGGRASSVPSVFRPCFIRGSTILAVLLSGSVAIKAASPDGPAFFEAKIRPLFIEHCQKCHGEKKQEGGLRLDTKPGWQKGGEHGAVIVPGDPDKSRLIQAVRRKDKDLQMPPKRALGSEEVAALEQWVKLGAPDPRESVAVAKSGVDPAAVRKHWAFHPLTHPQPPTPTQKLPNPTAPMTNGYDERDKDELVIHSRAQQPFKTISQKKSAFSDQKRGF